MHVTKFLKVIWLRIIEFFVGDISDIIEFSTAMLNMTFFEVIDACN